MLKTAKFVNTSNWRVGIKNIEIIEMGRLSAQALAGITYFSQEGRNYRLDFDYFANKSFFDSFTVTDGLFYDTGIRFTTFDKEEHYVWIPKVGGLNINYKTGIITINGVDGVSRAIKKAQETEIKIERFTRDIMLEHYLQTGTLRPDPVPVKDETIYDRIPYETTSAIKHILNTAGVDHSINTLGFVLPNVRAGYDVMDVGLDFEYVEDKIFKPLLREDASWHFRPQQFRAFPIRMFSMGYNDFSRTYLFAYQQHYRAISTWIAGGIRRYEGHEFIYRVTGFIYPDKPFFYDRNSDGVDIYDGRKEDNYIFDWGDGQSTERYWQIRSSGVMDNLQLASMWWANASNHLYSEDRWRTFRFYVTDSYRIERLPTSNNIPIVPAGANPYWFDDDRDFLRYFGNIKMNQYMLEMFDIDDDPIEQRRKVDALPADQMLKQLLFMSNLVMVNQLENVEVTDKNIYTNETRRDIAIGLIGTDHHAGREIVPGDPELPTLPNPIVQAWDAETGGNLLGQTSQSGVMDIQTDTTYYINLQINFSRSVVIYYTLNGLQPLPGSHYTFEFQPAISDRIAVIGSQRVRCYAYRQDHNLSAEIDVNINPVAVTQIPRPIITPGSGIYRNSLSIRMTCEDEDATIHYALARAEPTGSSPVYTRPIRFPLITKKEDVIVQAIATRDGFSDSEIAKARYTVMPTFTINEKDIIDLDKTSQFFDVSKLSSFRDIAHADQVESYLKQFYESKLDRFFEVVKVVVDYDKKINVRDFVMIMTAGIGLRFVASARTDERSGLQTLELWECEI